MKQEGKQRKWPEPVSVRAGCGGSARRRSFVSVKEVAFCFFAVWRFSVKVFCGSPFFFDVARSHWRGIKHWFYATPGPNIFSFNFMQFSLFLFL